MARGRRQLTDRTGQPKIPERVRPYSAPGSSAFRRTLTPAGRPIPPVNDRRMAAIEISVDSSNPASVTVAGETIRIELADTEPVDVAGWLESLDPKMIEDISMADDVDLTDGVTASILRVLAQLARGI